MRDILERFIRKEITKYLRNLYQNGPDTLYQDLKGRKINAQ